MIEYFYERKINQNLLLKIFSNIFQIFKKLNNISKNIFLSSTKFPKLRKLSKL